MKRQTRLSCIALLLAMTACLPIPHRHTVRTGMRVQVVDQSGQPIADALVAQYAGSIVGDQLVLADSVRTGPDGMATIAIKRAWHPVLFLMPDAEAPSIFGWCTSASGFAALGGMLSDGAHEVVRAPLVRQTVLQQCPAQLRRSALTRGLLAEPAREDG